MKDYRGDIDITLNVAIIADIVGLILSAFILLN